MGPGVDGLLTADPAALGTDDVRLPTDSDDDVLMARAGGARIGPTITQQLRPCTQKPVTGKGTRRCWHGGLYGMSARCGGIACQTSIFDIIRGRLGWLRIDGVILQVIFNGSL